MRKLSKLDFLIHARNITIINLISTKSEKQVEKTQ